MEDNHKGSIFSDFAQPRVRRRLGPNPRAEGDPAGSPEAAGGSYRKVSQPSGPQNRPTCTCSTLPRASARHSPLPIASFHFLLFRISNEGT